MALLKTIEINGQTIKNAYHRIDTINGCKNILKISVNIYSSEDKFNSGQGYLMQKMYDFTPNIEDDSPNFIKQGYDYLKSLNEYKNADKC